MKKFFGLLLLFLMFSFTFADVQRTNTSKLEVSQKRMLFTDTGLPSGVPVFDINTGGFIQSYNTLTTSGGLVTDNLKIRKDKEEVLIELYSSYYTFNWSGYTNQCDSAITNIVNVTPSTIPTYFTGMTTYLFEAGEYTLSNSIVATEDCTVLKGDGDVIINGDGTNDVINLSGNSYNIIENLKIDGITKNGDGIEVINSNSNAINNIEVINTKYGIYLNPANNTFINNSKIHNNAIAYYLTNSNNNIANSSLFFNNSQYGVYINPGSYNTINNSAIFNNSSFGFLIMGGAGNVSNNMEVYNNNQNGIRFVAGQYTNNIKTFNNISNLFLNSTIGYGYLMGDVSLPVGWVVGLATDSLVANVGWLDGDKIQDMSVSSNDIINPYDENGTLLVSIGDNISTWKGNKPFTGFVSNIDYGSNVIKQVNPVIYNEANTELVNGGTYNASFYIGEPAVSDPINYFNFAIDGSGILSIDYIENSILSLSKSVINFFKKVVFNSSIDVLGAITADTIKTFSGEVYLPGARYFEMRDENVLYNVYTNGIIWLDGILKNEANLDYVKEGLDGISSKKVSLKSIDTSNYYSSYYTEHWNGYTDQCSGLTTVIVNPDTVPTVFSGNTIYHFEDGIYNVDSNELWTVPSSCTVFEGSDLAVIKGDGISGLKTLISVTAPYFIVNGLTFYGGHYQTDTLKIASDNSTIVNSKFTDALASIRYVSADYNFIDKIEGYDINGSLIRMENSDYNYFENIIGSNVSSIILHGNGLTPGGNYNVFTNILATNSEFHIWGSNYTILNNVIIVNGKSYGGLYMQNSNYTVINNSEFNSSSSDPSIFIDTNATNNIFNNVKALNHSKIATQRAPIKVYGDLYSDIFTGTLTTGSSLDAFVLSVGWNNGTINSGYTLNSGNTVVTYDKYGTPLYDNTLDEATFRGAKTSTGVLTYIKYGENVTKQIQAVKWNSGYTGLDLYDVYNENLYLGEREENKWEQYTSKNGNLNFQKNNKTNFSISETGIYIGSSNRIVLSGGFLSLQYLSGSEWVEQ